MWDAADSLMMNEEQREQLQRWVSAPSTPQKVVLRARICLLANQGLSNRRIAQELQTSRPTVILWRNHFSSWLNLVERWFAEITRKRIRRGAFKSVQELIGAIGDYIKINNENPKPFVWTKRVDEILKKVNHCKASTVTAH